MITQLFARLLKEVSPKILFKTASNLCLKNMLNIIRFEQRQRCQSKFFPGFVIISLTSRCNLACEGCWVTTQNSLDMPLEMARTIIRDSMAKGSYYFGLVGGEPLIYPWLFDLLQEFPQAYFQLFTNGTLLTSEVTARLRRFGNVTPLISIEGLAEESDRRRSGKGVFASALTAIDNCRRHRLLIGVATSVCAANIDEMVSDHFIDELVKRKVHYLWYYIYRPVGERPHPELALSREHILRLRRFMVDARLRHPIGIIDAYWDADGRAVCPGAMGLSHHISPQGHIEFCPPLQFAFEQLKSGESFADKIASDKDMADLRRRVACETRGCILLCNPSLLQSWLQQLNAVDSGGRNSAYTELAAMTCRPCHDLPGCEIPEKSLFYRLAKRFSFFGFSAYG